MHVSSLKLPIPFDRGDGLEKLQIVNEGEDGGEESLRDAPFSPTPSGLSFLGSDFDQSTNFSSLERSVAGFWDDKIPGEGSQSGPLLHVGNVDETPRDDSMSISNFTEPGESIKGYKQAVRAISLTGPIKVPSEAEQQGPLEETALTSVPTNVKENEHIDSIRPWLDSISDYRRQDRMVIPVSNEPSKSIDRLDVCEVTLLLTLSHFSNTVIFFSLSCSVNHLFRD